MIAWCQQSCLNFAVGEASFANQKRLKTLFKLQDNSFGYAQRFRFLGSPHFAEHRARAALPCQPSEVEAALR
jgi:hypothetical protein